MILRSQSFDRHSFDRKVMNVLRAKFFRCKLVVWYISQRSWDTFIPPLVEAVYSSSDVDGPTFLADLDLRQGLVILRTSTRCKSSAKVWTGNTEELIRISDLFAKLEECLQQLQMRDTVIRRNCDDWLKGRPLRERVSKLAFEYSGRSIPRPLRSGRDAPVEH
jgi:hypothetical protein